MAHFYDITKPVAMLKRWRANCKLQKI